MSQTLVAPLSRLSDAGGQGFESSEKGSGQIHSKPLQGPPASRARRGAFHPDRRDSDESNKNTRSRSELNSLRGSSVNIGTIQIILAWPLRKDDAHESISEDYFKKSLLRDTTDCGVRSVGWLSCPFRLFFVYPICRFVVSTFWHSVCFIKFPAFPFAVLARAPFRKLYVVHFEGHAKVCIRLPFGTLRRCYDIIYHSIITNTLCVCVYIYIYVYIGI